MARTKHKPTEQTQEFDGYKDHYSQDIEDALSFAGQSHDFYMQAKVNYLEKFIGLHNQENAPLQILDVGCGHGLSHSYFQDKYKGRIILQAVDPAASVIEDAQKQNPNIAYKSNDGKTLPYDDNSFDIVQTICVMHHVPPQQWTHFIKEMQRVTKIGGHIIVFEHNPYNPITRHIVNNCPLDENAVLLNKGVLKSTMREAGLSDIQQDFILFFPFRHHLFRLIEKWLTWLPLGAQYVSYAQKT